MNNELKEILFRKCYINSRDYKSAKERWGEYNDITDRRKFIYEEIRKIIIEAELELEYEKYLEERRKGEF